MTDWQIKADEDYLILMMRQKIETIDEEIPKT
jgi:hypothetical protein